MKSCLVIIFVLCLRNSSFIPAIVLSIRCFHVRVHKDTRIAMNLGRGPIRMPLQLSKTCVTLKTPKPMLRFSPWPTFLWIFMSLCCSEIRTSSASFVMSNKYCKRRRGEYILCAYMHTRRAGCERTVHYLWVLQERLPVVRTAAAAVQQWLRILGPAPKVHNLVPRLMNTDH